jgi:hypothetical protein
MNPSSFSAPQLVRARFHALCLLHELPDMPNGNLAVPFRAVWHALESDDCWFEVQSHERLAIMREMREYRQHFHGHAPPKMAALNTDKGSAQVMATAMLRALHDLPDLELALLVDASIDAYKGTRHWVDFSADERALIRHQLKDLTKHIGRPRRKCASNSSE